MRSLAGLGCYAKLRQIISVIIFIHLMKQPAHLQMNIKKAQTVPSALMPEHLQLLLRFVKVTGSDPASAYACAPPRVLWWSIKESRVPAGLFQPTCKVHAVAGD